MAEEGYDGRLVTGVWVAMEGTLDESAGSSNLVSVKATIILSPGTIFAYQLHKVKSWSDHKRIVGNIEMVYYHMS